MGAFGPIFLMIALQYVDLKELGLDGVMTILFALTFAFSVIWSMYMRTLIMNSPSRNDPVDSLRDDSTGKLDKEHSETTTVEMHDRRELVKQVFRLCIFTLVTFYTKAITPMVMQTVMMPYTLLDSNLAKVYIWGKEPTGMLKRPWRGISAGIGDQIERSVHACEVKEKLKAGKKSK